VHSAVKGCRQFWLVADEIQVLGPKAHRQFCSLMQQQRPCFRRNSYTIDKALAKIDFNQATMRVAVITPTYANALGTDSRAADETKRVEMTMKHASILVLVGGSADNADLDPILQSAASDRTHLSFLLLETLQGPPV